jgi:kynurenine formamidase
LKIVDLTAVIKADSLVFPGYVRPAILKWTDLEKHGYYSNLLYMVEHTLTHVDSPAHFLKNANTIDEVPLNHFVGRATAIDLRSKKEDGFITKADLQEYIKKDENDIVLLYTGWEEYMGREEYFVNYPGLSKDGAEFLRDVNVKAVGIDGPDIDSYKSKGFPAHKILLGAGIVIYEGLINLGEISGKKFNFVGLPLKIHMGSASPVRAVAIIE